jgi:hypothetical protein
MIEAEAVGGHGVELGCSEVGVIPIACLPPTLVVGHEQDDVRPPVLSREALTG